MTEDKALAMLRADLTPYASKSLGSLRIDMDEVRAILSVLDRIEQLTAEVERKDAEIARLHLDIEAQECLQDSAYRAGMKFGWNCAVDDDRKSYDAVMSSTEHVAVLKRIREARAALEGKQ